MCPAIRAAGDCPAPRRFLAAGAPPSSNAACRHRRTAVSVSLFVEAAEQRRAALRHRRVSGVAAWHRRPAALLDEGALLPGVDLIEFCQARGGIGAVLELVDADRRQRGYKRRADALLGHLLCSSAGDPAAPIEANNECRDGTRSCTLQKSGGRVSLKD